MFAIQIKLISSAGLRQTGFDLAYYGDGLRRPLHIIGIQAGQAHPSAGDQLNAEFITQPIDLLWTESRITEYAALLQQIIKIMRR